MGRHEVAKRFDEIVEFAEVEKFIDTPVKRYSSGMYLRLAFAVAAHLEPEILIVDEVLSVGDLPFQHKCLGQMQSISREGRTVLFVSHNLPAVETLCKRGIIFEAGRLAFAGSQRDAIATYLASVRAGGRRAHTWIRFQGRSPSTSKKPILVGGRVALLDGKGGTPRMGQAFRIEVACFSRYEIAEPSLGIGINSAD